MTTPTIVCDSAHHYFVNGIRCPGVTEVLLEAGIVDFSMVNEHVLERGMLRGSFVHLGCEYLDRNELDWDTLDPVIEPYIRAYAKFKADTGFIPELIEHTFYNEQYGYAGTLDRTGVLNGRDILLDLKSGNIKQPSIPYQISAYERSMVDKRRDRYALELRKNGTYKLSDPILPDMNRFTDFLAMVRVWKLKERLGKLKENKEE